MPVDRLRRGAGALALFAAVALPGVAGAAEPLSPAERAPYLSSAGDAPGAGAGARVAAAPAAPPSADVFRRADVSVFYDDEPGDSNQAADLLAFTFSHLDFFPGTAADDRLELTTRLDGNPLVPGAQSDLINGDVVVWVFDTDSNLATGDAEGFDRVVRVRGVTDRGDTYEFDRWVPGSGFVRDDRFTDVPPFGPDSVGWSVNLADWGASRGGGIRWFAFSIFGESDDFAPPNEGDFFFFGVPDGPFAPTVGPAPRVSTVGTDSLTFSGSVDPRGLETSYFFQYGTTPAYGAETARQSAGAGRGAVPVSGSATGLAEGTTYHFRLVASNAAGQTAGPNQTALTARTPRPPDAVTRVPSNIRERSVTINGTVNPNGRDTRYFFEWGRTASYGQRTPEVALPATAGPTAVRAKLRNLRRNGSYHYRLVAANADGTKVGEDMRVRTARPDVVQSILRITHACSRSTRVCQITNMPLRVQVVDGDTGRPLGAAARRGLTVSIRVRARADGPLTAGFRLTPRVRTRALGTGARRLLRIGGSATTSRTDLSGLFPGRFAPGTSIELRVNGRGVTGAYHRIDFTRSRVAQRNCFLPPGSRSPKSCERL